MIKLTSFLSITSDTMSATQIAASIGIRADREVLKGSERIPARPTPGRHGWNISCEFEKIVSLDTAITELINRIRPSSSIISRLSDEKKIELSVKVAIISSEEMVPLFISPEVITEISSIKSSLDIELFD